jgi:hypothetical protein
MRRVHSCSVFERRHGDAAMFVQRPTNNNMGHREATGQR